MKIKKSGTNIIVPKKSGIIMPDNPFDYLNALKAGGAKATHGDEFDPAALASSRSVIAAGNFEDAEIDIAKQIRDVVDSKIIVPKDMKIDDGDLPTAANFYQWVTEERFGAVDEERPFIEQLIWGVITFNDVCYHCSDLEWLFHDHKADDTYAKFERKVCLLEHGVCPNCKRGRSNMILSGKMPFRNELAVNAGQRSGKSHTVGGYLYPYLTHRVLKLQKPAAFYGLSRTTVLHATFVALTYAQAKDTLWTPFYGAITTSGWYREYHSMLRFYENKYDESLLKLNDTFVVYRARGIMIYPSGPDKRILRGRTRFSCSIDEIAYFDSNKDSNKVKINAHEVYDALTNSLYTVRAAAERLINNGVDDVFPGYSMNVTSPVARNDMIHVLGERAKTSDSIYYAHRPTWEVNPDFPRNSRLIIDAYKKDPDSAEKNFGANPPLIANPFISNHDHIIGAEDIGRKNCVKLKPIMKNSRKQGQSYMYAEVEKVKKSGKPSMMTIDAGLTDNSFAMAGGRNVDLNIVVDFATEIIPAKGFKINHSLVYSDVILPIMQARNCKILLADRWNSAKLLDDARMDMSDPDDEDDNFIATNYSLKYKDMASVRTCLEQGIVRLPKSEIRVTKLLEVLDSDYRDFYDGKPIAHLFKQLYTIKDLEKQVGKGDGYTDDIWRAVALLVWGLMEEEYQGILLSEPDDVVAAKPTALAFSRLYSGGGGQVGQGGGSQTLINGAPLGVMARSKR